LLTWFAPLFFRCDGVRLETAAATATRAVVAAAAA